MVKEFQLELISLLQFYKTFHKYFPYANLWLFIYLVRFALGNVHKGSPMITGHFGHTYLPMSDVFYELFI